MKPRVIMMPTLSSPPATTKLVSWQFLICSECDATLFMCDTNLPIFWCSYHDVCITNTFCTFLDKGARTYIPVCITILWYFREILFGSGVSKFSKGCHDRCTRTFPPSHYVTSQSFETPAQNQIWRKLVHTMADSSDNNSSRLGDARASVNQVIIVLVNEMTPLSCLATIWINVNSITGNNQWNSNRNTKNYFEKTQSKIYMVCI